MGRFRVSEIALGFLAATALWVTVAIIYPKTLGGEATPGNDASPISAPESPPQLEAETNRRIADYNRALDWLTFGLVIANIALWWVTWRSGVRHSEDMEAQILETRRIGEAQVRAYVDIIAATVVFGRFAEGVAPAPDVQPFVKIIARNYGQSPARNFVWNPAIECFGMGAETKSIVRELGANWREIRGVGISAGAERPDSAVLPLLLMKFLRENNANTNFIIVRLRIQFEFEDVFNVRISDEIYFSGGFIRKPGEVQQTDVGPTEWMGKLSPVNKPNDWPTQEQIQA